MMSWLYELWRRLLFLLGREQFDRDLAEEMRRHVEMKAQRLIDAGVAPEEARYRAQREFGNAMLLKETSRELWQWRPMEEIAQDLRYAVRMLRRSPGFTAVAIVSLALGIGANTAVFSAMDTVLLKSLPVEDPERLVVVQAQCRGEKWIFMNPTFRDLRDRQPVFSGMFAVSDNPSTLVASNAQDAAYIPGSVVSGNYFSVLGVRPQAGRMFTERDDHLPGTGGAQDRVTVISYGYWQRHFGGDAAIVGRKIEV